MFRGLSWPVALGLLRMSCRVCKNGLLTETEVLLKTVGLGVGFDSPNDMLGYRERERRSRGRKAAKAIARVAVDDGSGITGRSPLNHAVVLL